MKLRLLVVTSSFLFGSYSVAPQQTSLTATSDPQALTILGHSISAMGATTPLDSVATGSITVVSGSLTQSGTIRVLTKGTAESSVQMTMPDETRTIIFANGQANDVVGDTVSTLPLELVVTSQAADYPLPLITALLNNPDTSYHYVGLESSNGQSLQHIQVWDTFASQPALQSLASFSLRDIWFDAVSGLPQKISYVQKPAQGATPSVAMDVFYSNYQAFSGGVLYPLTIQKSVNGTPWASISIQNVSFNTGLTDSSFPIQ